MQLTGNTILITGGTSGIGRALAEAFHERGNQVIIVGRRQALLDEITAAHPGMRALPLDVQDPDAIDAFVVQIRQAFPHLNVLINNAGISIQEDLTADDIDISVTRSMIQTNIMSALYLTEALLPSLRGQQRSTIMATSSALAFVPSAMYPAYCASKAFLHSWLESLRFQLRNTSVEVLELIPTYVQTELTGTAQATDAHATPLPKYIAEAMQLLGNSQPPRGEILVKSGEALRFAERNGTYQQTFTGMNSR